MNLVLCSMKGSLEDKYYLLCLGFHRLNVNRVSSIKAKKKYIHIYIKLTAISTKSNIWMGISGWGWGEKGVGLWVILPKLSFFGTFYKLFREIEKNVFPVACILFQVGNKRCSKVLQCEMSEGNDVCKKHLSLMYFM